MLSVRTTNADIRLTPSRVRQECGFRWSADNLDRWLTDPGKFLAGTRMPVHVLDASARRDIIAYLQKESRHTGDASEPKSIAQRSSERSRKQ